MQLQAKKTEQQPSPIAAASKTIEFRPDHLQQSAEPVIAIREKETYKASSRFLRWVNKNVYSIPENVTEQRAREKQNEKTQAASRTQELFATAGDLKPAEKTGFFKKLFGRGGKESGKKAQTIPLGRTPSNENEGPRRAA